MSEVKSWSGTAASNNSAPPDGFPEAMAYSAVNNAARELMAAVVRWHDDFDGELVSGGSSSAYTLTPNVTYSGYEAGMSFLFIANHANTGASTLNVSALGVKSIKDSQGNTLVSGSIGSRQLCLVVYDATSGYFRLLAPRYRRYIYARNITDGDSFTIDDGARNLVHIGTTTRATATIIMPASPVDGDTISFSFAGAITAVTHQASGADTLKVPLTTVAAGDFASWVYRTGTTTWYRCG